MSDLANIVHQARASLLHLEVFAEGDDVRRIGDAIEALTSLEREVKRLRSLSDDHFRNSKRLANLLNKHERERGRP